MKKSDGLKLTLSKEVLENALATLQPFVEKKDATAITSHILFEVEKDSLILKASDLEIGLSVKISEFTASGDGKFTASGKKTLDLVRGFRNDGEITIEVNGENITIKQKKVKHKLPSMEPDMFPNKEFNLDSIEQSELTVNNESLITGIKKIIPAIATNNPKYEVNGALFDIRDEAINLVSTDTKRLAVFKIKHAGSNKPKQVIIHKKAITEIQKIFLDEIKMFYDGTNLTIKSGNYYFFTKVINGRYPDYERIIPREHKHVFTLNTAAFIEAIEQVSILEPRIKITFKNGEIDFASVDDGNESSEASIETEIKIDEPLTISLNSKYFLEFLKHCDGETFDMKINDANVPFTLESGDFTTITMPEFL
ncbi:MAG: DNA polymerase III subunit beta [Helicobacteraceae bacterium]|jgi:DNA polymerase-3 subunit beta|nr:DNA polymerase III subunit beta [Helicobacteraceae bacterium]